MGDASRAELLRLTVQQYSGGTRRNIISENTNGTGRESPRTFLRHKSKKVTPHASAQNLTRLFQTFLGRNGKYFRDNNTTTKNEKDQTGGTVYKGGGACSTTIDIIVTRAHLNPIL